MARERYYIFTYYETDWKRGDTQPHAKSHWCDVCLDGGLETKYASRILCGLDAGRLLIRAVLAT